MAPPPPFAAPAVPKTTGSCFLPEGALESAHALSSKDTDRTKTTATNPIPLPDKNAMSNLV